MSSFRTVAHFHVKGWCKLPAVHYRDYDARARNRQVEISLTNNEQYIVDKNGYSGYPDCDHDIRVDLMSVDDEAAEGGYWKCGYASVKYTFRRSQLDMLGKDYDASLFRELLKDETAETLELFWELLLQFNEVIFLNFRTRTTLR